MAEAHVHAGLALPMLQRPCGASEQGSPVALPELPEDHVELGEVALRVLAAELKGLGALGRHLQLLDQLLVAPAAGHIQSMREIGLKEKQTCQEGSQGGQAAPHLRAADIP